MAHPFTRPATLCHLLQYLQPHKLIYLLQHLRAAGICPRSRSGRLVSHTARVANKHSGVNYGFYSQRIFCHRFYLGPWKSTNVIPIIKHTISKILSRRHSVFVAFFSFLSRMTDFSLPKRGLGLFWMQ